MASTGEEASMDGDGDRDDTGRMPPTGLRSAVDQLVEHARRLAESVRDAGSAAVGAAPPLPAAAGDVLQSLRAMLDSAPSPTAAVDVLAEEVRAKRALVRAMQEQLASFDTQLELFERSLVPLQEWGRQWSRLQSAVSAPLRRG
jgi:hypothetical protein